MENFYFSAERFVCQKIGGRKQMRVVPRNFARRSSSIFCFPILSLLNIRCLVNYAVDVVLQTVFFFTCQTSNQSQKKKKKWMLKSHSCNTSSKTWRIVCWFDWLLLFCSIERTCFFNIRETMISLCIFSVHSAEKSATSWITCNEF